MPFHKPTKTRADLRNDALLLDERAVPLIIRVHPKSRSMIVRWCSRTQSVLLTLPRRASLKEGMAFVESRKHWLRTQVLAEPKRIAFADGVSFTVLGETLTVRHMPEGHNIAWRDGNLLCVGGDAIFLPNRVQRWLLTLAHQEITDRTRQKARMIGKEAKRVSLRDPTSRWGSCGANGHLSFSWRLILAPPEVMDYVICHEVAHLVHLNHSARFWNVVATLCPTYNAHRGWLRKHGETLHAIG